MPKTTPFLRWLRPQWPLWGVNCPTANSLADGCRHWSEGPVDALLLALDLPDSSGLATLDAVMARSPRFPVILLGLAGDDEIVNVAVTMGIGGYLRPASADPVSLATTLSITIDQHRRDARLARREIRYRGIIESLGDAYFEVDLEGNYLYLNDESCRHFGRGRKN